MSAGTPGDWLVDVGNAAAAESPQGRAEVLLPRRLALKLYPEALGPATAPYEGFTWDAGVAHGCSDGVRR
jgi:hypothetical protein